MRNLNNFLAASTGTIIAVVFLTITSVIFAGVMFTIWWISYKKKTMKDLGKIIKRGYMNLFGKINDIFTSNSSVKTVYSDKSLNYSGTEFLPIPTKAPTDRYTYEFVGWDKNCIDENGNTVVRAIYLQKVAKCCINIFDDDKQTLFKTVEVEYGAGVNLDDLKPEKPETKEFSYEFVGWDKEIDAFYNHENVYAVYKAIPKKYTYTFLDEDEKTVLNQGTAVYGTPIVAPSAPAKESSKEFDFEFSGWRGYEEGMTLLEDIVFVATYETIPKKVMPEFKVQSDIKYDTSTKEKLSDSFTNINLKTKNNLSSNNDKVINVEKKESQKVDDKIKLASEDKIFGNVILHKKRKK